MADGNCQSRQKQYTLRTAGAVQCNNVANTVKHKSHVE